MTTERDLENLPQPSTNALFSEAYERGVEDGYSQGGKRDAADSATHAGECALCRAPWVRAADGSARPSCDCVKV